MGTQLPSPKRGKAPSFYCGHTAGCIKMLLDMEVGLSRRYFVFDGHPTRSPPKKGGGPPPIFGPCLLRPNGCMHQDSTLYGGRPRPRGHCIRWGLSSRPQKGGGAPPRFSTHVYCGQTAEWIKMSLGMEVGLSLHHIVLDGDPAPLPKGGRPPQFSAHF